MLLVIVGARTHTSAWVRWKIERAQDADVNLALVAVKLNARYAAPASLVGVGTLWVHGFSQARILDTLRTARRPA